MVFLNRARIQNKTNMFGELEKIISLSENKWILKGLKDTDPLTATEECKLSLPRNLQAQNYI